MYFTDDKKEKLLVTEIERGALHDGPGIRTTVFLAGCPFHCPWCCNPETQPCRVSLMHDPDLCVGCGKCVTICPAGAARMKDGKPVFDRNVCTSCEECVNGCPTGALSFAGRFMTVDEIVEEVLSDCDYYEASGGGVTLSGGEPFFQSKGALKLLERLKAENLHTAVETTACIDKNILKEASSFVDLFLIDIKHSDAKILKEVTGEDLDTVCSNVQMLVSLGAEVWLRTPVIPDFNYNEDTIQNIFKLIKELGVKKAVLLPYHSLGKSKYKKLSLPYPMGETSMLSEADMKIFAQIGKNFDLNVTIGE